MFAIESKENTDESNYLQGTNVERRFSDEN